MRNIDEQFSGLRFCVGRGEKNRTVTLAICSLCFTVSAERIWVEIMPQA
jgi:hypothetical protein